MRIARNLRGFAVATTVLAIPLAGCTTSSPHESEPVNEGDPAAAFVACLVAGGLTAKISDMDYVYVEAPGAQLELEIGSAGPDEPAGEAPLMIFGEADGSTWVAAESSAYFAHDPQTQTVYADCEADLPNFSQPAGGGGDDAEIQEHLALQSEHGLEFARCARDAGYGWVADPAGEPGTTQAIELPAHVSEQEFTSVLQECLTADLNIAWSIPEEPSFDWQRVLQEFVPAEGTG